MGRSRPVNASGPSVGGADATRLQGRDISTAAPATNNVLAWNDITSEWEPAAPGIPGAHALTHEDGGSDEIDVTGLSGELGDPQPPKPHAASHSDGGTDEVAVENLATASADISTALRPDGAGGVAFSDVAHADLTGVTSDLHHAQTHASAHKDGGADELSVEEFATAGTVNQVAKSDGAGGLAMGDVDHGELSGVGIDDHHARDHAATHDDGAADEVTVENLATAGASGTVPVSDGAGGMSMAAPAPAAHETSHRSGGSDQVDHDLLLNFVANEHIDWTNAAVNLVTTGDVTGTSIYGDGSNLSGVGAASATALTIEAKVNEAGGITKGQAVYISGATGQTPQVSLCDNTNSAKHGFIGLAAETKTDGQTILIRNRGELVGLVTSSWLDGDVLYLTTAGNLTKTLPTTGAIDHVGFVSYAHGSAGKILVTQHRHHGFSVASGEDIILRVGDSAGSNKVSFKDYADAEVASVDSDGNITGASLRAPRVMQINPEYQGAVLYPDGSNNEAAWVSGHDQTNHRNYMELTAEAATNDYEIVIEVRVPTGWTWDSAKIYVWTDDKTNNVMTVEIFDTTGTTDGSDTVTPSADNTWEEKTLTTPGGTYASEGLFHVHLKGTIGAAGKKVRFGAALFKSST